MVELKGSLDGVGVPAIVQLVGELRQTGRLDLDNAGAHAWLGFERGRLVAAMMNDRQGLNALAVCLHAFNHGDFVFVEHAGFGERTLDLGPDDLAARLSNVANQPLGSDETADDTLASPAGPATSGHSAEPGACPRLGFADDPERHYSRPTALHRCFAAPAPATISSQEQRELCLGGGYPACPRFVGPVMPSAHSESWSPAAFNPPLTSSPPAPPAESVTHTPDVNSAPPAPRRPATSSRTAGIDAAPPIEGPLPVNGTGVSVPPSRPQPAGVPPRVAARMAAVNQGGVTISEPQQPGPPRMRDDARPWLPTASGLTRFGGLSRRALVLVAVGSVLGLVLLVLGLAAFIRSTSSGLTGDEPAAVGVAGAQATLTSPLQPRPVASPSVRSQVASSPVPLALAPTVAPSRAPVSRQAAPSVAVQLPTPSTGIPTAQGPPPLLDVRFASGRPDGWLDNAPYATWSDGAYRLRVQDAGHFVAVGVPLAEPLRDVVVTATFRKTGGPPGGGYGLIVRDQGPEPRDGVNQNLNAYVLEAGDLGEFGIWRRDGDHWVDLVAWTRSGAVRPVGSPNELVVRATGDQITFSVNGVDLATVQNATLPAGGVGVFAGGDNNEVAVDHFAIQVPD